MSELDLSYIEFVSKYKANEIHVTVDINAAYLVLEKNGPPNWKWTLRILNILTFIGFLGGVILFFFVKWWIPIIIFIICVWTRKAMREESQKALIEESLKSEDLFIFSTEMGCLKLYQN